MKGRLAKVLSLSLICSMLFSMTALADVPLSGEGSATGTTPSEFSAEDVESSAVVRLPANLDLDFSEELGAFQIVSNVGVYGDIKDFAEISVSINEDLVYTDGALSPYAAAGSNELSAYEVPSGFDGYTYAYHFRFINNNTNGSNQADDDTLTVRDVKLVSKTPVFLAKVADGEYNDDTYGLYVYKDGDVARINNFVSANGTQTYTEYFPNGNGSEATALTPVGSVKCVSSTYKVYNASNELTSQGQNSNGFHMYESNYCPVTIQLCKDSTAFYVADQNSWALWSGYGYKQLQSSGLIFSSPNAAKDYFNYDEDDYNHVTGKVLFGENANGVCTETWNSDQAAAGLTNHDVNGEDDTDYRTIMVNVPSYEVTTSGTYFATAEFEINFTCVGMKSDIGATTKLSGKEIKESDYSYAWDEDYTSTASMVNLGRMGNKPFVISTSALKDNTSMQNIEHIQLADNTTTSYLTYIDDANPANCNSWLMGMHGVQVLVIPNSVTTEQLHKTAGNTRTIDQNTMLTVSNSVTAVFDETNTKIGNAMCFVKNIDANNKFIYVPHICYRGTKDEFKALSGYDNWVFGNKGNIITVHCTDGMMYY